MFLRRSPPDGDLRSIIIYNYFFEIPLIFLRFHGIMAVHKYRLRRMPKTRKGDLL